MECNPSYGKKKQRRGDEGQISTDWSALPDPALFSISRRLTNPVDFQSFGRACRAWRLVSKAAEGDFLASLPPLLYNPARDIFYNPIEDRAYKRNLINPSRDIFYNPIKDRPYKSFLIHPPGAPVARCFVNFSCGHLILNDPCDRGRPLVVNPFTGAVFDNFPRFPADAYMAILTSPPTSPDCRLLMFFHRGFYFCRSGERDWHVFQFWEQGERYDSFSAVYGAILFQGKVWAVVGRRHFLTIEFVPGCCDPVTTVLGVNDPSSTPSWCTLAEYSGELFSIHRKYAGYSRLEGFSVYRLDFNRLEWVELESLGDRALFVDKHFSYLLDGPAGWGVNRNCVHFDAVLFPSDFSINYVGVYNMTDRKITYRKSHCLKALGTSSAWVLPGL